MSVKQETNNLENWRPAEWLEEALASAGELEEFATRAPKDVSVAFRNRCREAALGRFVLGALREERRRIGFVPLPLADYLQGIAQTAGVPLAGVLAPRGIDDLTRTDEAAAPALAGLAREIGMSLREAMAHLRLAFAAMHGAPAPAVLARRHPAASSALQDVEAELERVETGYNAALADELHRLEAAFRSAFGR